MAVVGFLSGIISGMGIGGGAILIPALVILYGTNQQQAQVINLIYFVPTAIVAIIVHAKEGNIEKRVVKPVVLFGIIGAVAGSIIANRMAPELLRKIFGVFLVFMGIIEIRKKGENNG